MSLFKSNWHWFLCRTFMFVTKSTWLWPFVQCTSHQSKIWHCWSKIHLYLQQTPVLAFELSRLNETQPVCPNHWDLAKRKAQRTYSIVSCRINYIYIFLRVTFPFPITFPPHWLETCWRNFSTFLLASQFLWSKPTNILILPECCLVLFELCPYFFFRS